MGKIVKAESEKFYSVFVLTVSSLANHIISLAPKNACLLILLFIAFSFQPACFMIKMICFWFSHDMVVIQPSRLWHKGHEEAVNTVLWIKQRYCPSKNADPVGSRCKNTVLNIHLHILVIWYFKVGTFIELQQVTVQFTVLTSGDIFHELCHKMSYKSDFFYI